MSGLAQKGAITLTEDMLKIVEMLADHELALRELYQIYGEKVSSLKDLWLRLAEDEQRHADWLNSLASMVASMDPQAHCCWPRPAAIESSLKYIQVQILRARETEVSPLAALSVAKDLEDALLEKEFFKVGANTCPEVRAVLSRLVIGTEKHYQAVVEALDQVRRGMCV